MDFHLIAEALAHDHQTRERWPFAEELIEGAPTQPLEPQDLFEA
jgi:hypothetical protein